MRDTRTDAQQHYYGNHHGTVMGISEQQRQDNNRNVQQPREDGEHNKERFAPTQPVHQQRTQELHGQHD